VLSKAQHVLADGLSQPDMSQEVLSLIREPDLRSTLDKLETQCLSSAPSNAQSALHLLGFFLDWTYATHPQQREALHPRIAKYICILRATLADTNPFDARFAAANSICALHSIWRVSPSHKPTRALLLGLAFTLYDMLNDDDDEIRDAAARATTALIHAHSPTATTPAPPSVPILTSHRLAAFLTTHFSTSPHLCRAALRRLAATPPHTPPCTTPFAQTLARERQEDTTLFAAEKQNLFFDPTLDARFWARVLRRCSPPPTLANALGAWVADALRVLTATGEAEGGAALGWSSKSEVFTLGMRVLCAAEVALGWGVQNAVELRRLLVRFVVIGQEKEVGGLWVGVAEKVLAGSVLEVVRGAVVGIRAVERGLEKEKETQRENETKEDKGNVDEERVLSFLKGLGARVRATEGGLMKKAGM
jgi:hypothetical protein